MEPNARLVHILETCPEVYSLTYAGVYEGDLPSYGIGSWDVEKPSVYGEYLIVPVLPSQPRLYHIYLLRKSWGEILSDIQGVLASVKVEE